MPVLDNPASQGKESPKITLVLAYYENPGMLALQWKEISRYSEVVKAALEIIVVDDGSPRYPAVGVERGKGLPVHSIFRIGKDVRWNQDAARNIGAHEAAAPWLLLTDVDHVVPNDTWEYLLSLDADSHAFYTFSRIKYHDGDPRESHPNSYFMTKALYWHIGGHDEDFAGIYGKDFLFRKRAHKAAREILLDGTPLARVGSKAIADAGTRTITRKNTLRSRVWGYVLQWLKECRLWRGVQTLTHEYSRVI